MGHCTQPDVEHLYMCLSSIHTSSLVKYLSYVHFLIRVFITAELFWVFFLLVLGTKSRILHMGGKCSTAEPYPCLTIL
jgi:hypothetical protein